MTYKDTWFSRQPLGVCPAYGTGRQYWLHSYVVVDGEEQLRLSSGFSIGSHDRQGIQHALSETADGLEAAGAVIVSRRRNTVVARHGNETAHYTVAKVCAVTFFSHLGMTF